MPDVDFIRPYGVDVFAMFYCRLDFMMSVMLVVFSLSGFLSMCLFVFVFDCASELFV